ncbi:MAG: PQQ-binding-like beta-propeller repeat protein [Candidatus Latescibacteria bacterium]|nr:PQQ-binding-like beta-propeller repeat protein [Candidatus Latescibacterota bacterium]
MVRQLARMICIVTLIPLTVHADNWPQWRGPNQNGVSTAKNLPASWSLEKNLIWKTELPSWSGSTPIIWEDRIFLTSPSPAQTPEQQEPGGPELYILCLNRKDGSEIWRYKLDEGNRVWRKQNNTSPSPVTDGNHVWVVTGNGVVTNLDMDGKVIWARNIQKDYGSFGLNWGYASSPILYKGKLIIEVLHGMRTDDPSYIVALNAKDGKEIWREERATDASRESPDAYTTPALLEHNGETQIVITGGDYVTGHNPDTGKEIWRAGGLNPQQRGNYRIVASPVVVDDMIYAPTRQRPLLALPAGGKGDISDKVIWKWASAGAPDVPTPACDGTYFYMVDDRGRATCLNAKTGEVIWGPERTAQGTVSSSPLLADGKIYLLNENAVTTVLAAGPEFKLLSTNELDGTYTLSTPVAVDSQLFIRTATHLYCIGNGGE